ncbi:MAG: IS200/IS605 family transposase [Candidatus Dependentiae bacterium]|nr:IS200/IS605 family transposase [Candidatus Dependentiae bacterium]
MFHIVWIPKYRKRILRGPLAARLRELFEQCAEINKWEIKELNIQPYHVHMLVQIRTSVSVSYAVQMFKGGSSKVVRSEFPELEEFLWGESFWAGGHFVSSVGNCSAEKIKEYIRNQ